MKDGIKEIRIKNYQSLKKVELKLGNITAIVGPSDSGKSAFFRAVKAVVTNQDGSDFITVGEKQTKVSIDGVTWIQSDKENQYEIDGRKWDKVGRGVPDEVRQSLNMGEVEFGKDLKVALNFSGQLDPAFVVQGNPADNAKIIGSISNIHRIYNAIRNAEKDAKAQKRNINESTVRLEQLSSTLTDEEGKKSFLDVKFIELERIFNASTRIETMMSSLVGLKEKLNRVHSDIIRLNGSLKRFLGIDFDLISAKIARFSDINGIRARYNEVIDSHDALGRRTRRYEGVSFDGYTKTLTRYETLAILRINLVQTLNGIKDNRHTVKTSESEVVECLAKAKELGVCEVCGSSNEHWQL